MQATAPKPQIKTKDRIRDFGEVFTNEREVNAMLDLLPQELFSDPSATFLDPACKSGVFLREIARRLMLGLEPHFRDPRKRIAHILTHQLYGIAITELTALLSRRTLYGSKDVDNPTYSIPQKSGAALPQGGNIYYAPTPHSFKNAKCTYCGASQSQYDRDSTLESHAYAFIHELEPLEEFFASVKAPSPSQADTALSPSLRADEIGVAIHKQQKQKGTKADSSVDCHAANAARNDKATQSHPQGDTMSFSVIITNPPYQLATTQESAQATPLYNKFIDRAKALNPKHIVMIVPARWYSGGMGLKSFRASMLNDSRLVELHDFPNASDCFPDNAIEGGVCYFRWDSAKAESQRLLSDRGGQLLTAAKPHKCKIYTHRNGTIISYAERPLLEQGLDTFIRYNESISILHKVRKHNETTLDSIVSQVSPFNIPTNFSDYRSSPTPAHTIKLYRNGGIGYVESKHITQNTQWIKKHKVLVSEAYGLGALDGASQVIGKPLYAEPDSVCTHTYIVLGVFDTEREAQNLISYIRTKLFRFLVSLKKVTQHTSKKEYALVPLQDFSHAWSDEMLYKKYGLSEEEIAYIESRIKGM